MEIPTFSPSMEEFKDFENYLKTVSGKAHPSVGLARIVPPKEWLELSLKNKVDPRSLKIFSPIKQEVKGKSGSYKVENKVGATHVSFDKFKQLAEEQEREAKKYLSNVRDRNSFEHVSQVFWQSIQSGSPSMYGADSRGSLFDPNLEIWNLNRLPSILKVIGVEISGVTYSYLYFGMWKALFAAHTEDMDLYSINYLHDGAPKMWYAVPPASAELFEKLAASKFPKESKTCSEWLRHKQYLLDPKLLALNGVPYCCGPQKKGEFMVTFPRAYHWGFNSGFNIAEAVNFALEDWIPFGKNAGICSCRQDSVKIDMEYFLFCYISELREKGVLPSVPKNPEWIFSCPCGMTVSSEDPEILWPCKVRRNLCSISLQLIIRLVKDQFQCDKCDVWVHMECHGGKIPSPAWCINCQQSEAQAKEPAQKKACTVNN